MSAQFAHVQTHSRKISANHKSKDKAWTASDIASEARRDKEHSKHVENAADPIALIGDLTTLEQQLDDYLKSNKITAKNGVEREARQDAHVMISNVYSWPEHVDYYDEKRLDQFVKDCLKFHEKEFGKCDAAVLHLDEEFPHVHAYTFDKSAKDLHPGEVAKKEAKARGESSKEANKAYRSAMSDFQERFYQSVGKKNGLDRLGPKRQRIPRSEWREQKNERVARGDRIRELESEIEQQQIEAKALDAKNRALSDLNAKHEQSTAQLQKEAENAKKTALTAAEVVKKAQEKEKTLKSEILGLKRTKKSLENKVDQMSKIFNKIKSALGFKSAREIELESKLSVTEKAAKKIVDKFKETASELKSKTRELKSEQKSHAKTLVERDSATKKADLAEYKAEQKEHEIESLESEIVEIKAAAKKAKLKI